MLFKIEIETGNAGMLTFRDIAAALRGVAQKINEDGSAFVKTNRVVSCGSIFDVNGNKVGRWDTEKGDS